jgi:oxysterol-binding protein 1
MEFHKMTKSLFGKSKNIGGIDGEIKDADGQVHYYLKGLWNETLSMSPYNPSKKGFDEENATLLWKAEETPQNWERIYRFTRMGLQLNKINSEMKKWLPPTDSRLRTDQRALENGDLTLANTEKHRLEERQRASRKKREQERIEWKPNYFEEYIDEETGMTEYKYIRDYWEDRRKRNWVHMPDLFGQD